VGEVVALSLGDKVPPNAEVPPHQTSQFPGTNLLARKVNELRSDLTFLKLVTDLYQVKYTEDLYSSSINGIFSPWELLASVTGVSGESAAGARALAAGGLT
jgi:hypothetical protein